ncbi:uncharacterized protein QYS62_001797 [Fusarium acuminatum]|uniref:F-box domain-containing protein n=1 Tax=Fusarium acuminatum TaxID=5515 RepID=A0ABZ2WLY3_9HYPO
MIPHTESQSAVSIICIPPELLKHIFLHVLHARKSHATNQRPAPNVDDIRSLRLTCRRFCQLASPMLTPELNVFMTEASLERLKNVSCHQLIGSGVRSVHVKLPYYDRYLAATLSHFAYFHIYALDRHLSQLRAAINSEDSALRPFYEVPIWVDAAVLQVGEEMTSAWKSIYTGDPDDPDRDSAEHINYRNILRDAHRQYRLLFEAQEHMRQNGRFLSSITSAMARMPFVNRLDISDGQDINRKEDAYLIDRGYYASLRVVMLAPHTWLDASNMYARPDFEPPAEFLHRLPVEIHQAGVTLREINIQCSRPWSYAKLNMSSRERASLIESIQNLQTLTFDAGGKKRGTGWLPELRRGATDIVFDLLSAFLHASGLEHLTITFPEFALGSRSLGKVLGATQHKYLKKLRLTGATFMAGELEQYLAHFKSPCDIVLELPELLSGTWAEETTYLRSHSGVLTTVVAPLGAELSDEQFRCTWNPEEERMLNEYLQRASSANPFTKNI